MGVVYRAEDTRLGRQVALKTLPPEMAEDPDRLERFQREAQAIAKLNHPSIVTVYSVEEADGIHFLTMELVEGRTLNELIQPGGLSLDRQLAIARPLADALSAAHAQGVVHRDLKPANIMVTKEGRVKVLDFGLAKVAALVGDDPGDARTELLTEPGRVMGTAPYMSPEQVKGGVVDARSDIFSLGIILFEMATGSRPFRGDTPADLVSSTLRDQAAPVSEIRDDLPRQLGRIVGHCLAKDVEERYQTAKDVRKDLAGLEREVVSGAVTPPVRARPRRRSVLLSVVGAAAVLLLVALVYRGLGTRPNTPDAYAIAVLPFENLIGSAEKEYVATGIGSGLITALSEVTGLRVVSRAEAWSAAARARGAGGDSPSSGSTALARRLGVNALIEGEVQREVDRLLVTLRVIDGDTGRVLWPMSFRGGAEEIFTLQKEIAGKLVSVLSIPLSGNERSRLGRDPTRSFKAYDLFLQAEDHLVDEDDTEGPNRAAELFRQAIRVDAGFALAHVGLSNALASAYRLHKDPTALEEAEAEARLALELDPRLPAAQVALARVLRSTGQTAASIAGIEEALADHPNPATAQRELAYAYERAQDLAGAERCLRAATALAGDDWFTWNWLGMFLARNGRYDEARRAFEKASAVAPADTYLPRENLATTDLSTGRHRQAVEAFQDLPQEMVQSRPRLASNIGTAYFFSDHPDRLERALEHYRLAVELRPNHADYHRNLGDAYLEAGRADEAGEEYRRALSLKEADLERDPANPRFELEWAQYAAKAQLCPQAVLMAEELDAKLAASGGTAHQLAYVFALCGRRESALAALARAIEMGESPATIRREAEFESLRGNPAFEQLLGG
jgi:TolB-like protein/Flp pilus assembly protein TadD